MKASFFSSEKIMTSPLKDGGAMSRRIQNQAPAAAAGGAVIGLYLVNLATLFLANVLRYAFSHSTRMYLVGLRFWGILAFAAFAQGAFKIGSPTSLHPAVMFLLFGLMFVMNSQSGIIETLHLKRHERSKLYLDIYLEGLTAEIAIMTVILWSGVALALWWSPDLTTILKWVGLGEVKLSLQKFWYFWGVIVFFQIILGNYAVKFMIGNRVDIHAKNAHRSLANSERNYTDAERKLIQQEIDRQHEQMKSELKLAQKAYPTWLVLAVPTVLTGLYWLVLWYFHGYQISWTNL